MGKKIETIRMVKPDQKPGLPDIADVHPDEVVNMQNTGWMVDVPKKGKSKKGTKKAE